MGRIDRIIIENFKSYGGSHVLGPFKEFTAIIGPNGSGKSNVLDAISFVLGVKSSSLRGSALTDLIHKKPGEENQENTRNAYVELIYEEESGKFLTFRRSISRTGVSSYSFNGSAIPWKSYEEELSKLGVLVRAKNFLVFQGDVESIAQKTPKEFTELIETISSSAALKREYEELKISSEEASEEFIRTFEKKRNMVKEKKQIREQKEEAERFQEIQQEMREKRKDFQLWQLRQNELEKKEKEKEKIKEESLLESRKELVAAEEEKVAEFASVGARVRREIATEEKKLSKFNKTLEKRRPEAIQLRTAIEHAKRAIVEEEKKLKDQTGKAATQQAEIRKLEEELDQVTGAIEEMRQQIESDTHKGKELKMAEAQLAEYNQLQLEAAEATAELRQKAQEARTAFTRDDDELEKLRSDLETLRNRKETVQEQIEESRERLKRLKDQAAATKKQAEAERRRLDEMKKANAKATERKSKLTGELEVVVNQLAEAKADRLDTQHEAKMAELVELLKAHFPGVRGRMTDLCKPSNKKFNLAIAIAMGRNMESVVVDDHKTAVECIEYLRTQRAGQLTFIPLDSIKAKPVQESLRQLGGSAQLALDVLSFDDVYQRAMLYALGNTLICDTLEEAKKIAYGPMGQQGKRPKIVSLDGSVVHKSGNLEGGVGKFHQRAKQWDEGRISQLKQKKEEFVEELRTLEDVEKQRDQENSLTTEVANLEERARRQESELRAIEEKVKKLESQAEGIDKELNQRAPEVKRLEGNLEKRQRDLEAAEKALAKDLDRLYAAFSKKIGVSNIRQYEEERLMIAKRHMEQKSLLSTQETRLREQLNYEKRRDLNEAANDTVEKIRKIKEKIKELTGNEEKLNKELDAEKLALNEVIEQLKKFNKALEENMKEIKTAKKAASAAQESVDSLEKHVAMVQTQMEAIAEQREEILRRCTLEQIEIPFIRRGEKRKNVAGRGGKRKRRRGQESDEDEEEEEAEEEEDGVSADVSDGSFIDYSSLTGPGVLQNTAEREKTRQSYQMEISALQAELERLAPNLKAIERYDEVAERLESSKSEWEAKKNRSKELADRFEECRARRVELFMSCFNHVAKAIGQVYTALTRSPQLPTGGKAYLTLESNEEPYNHGIKYTAMPPMKRFRPMEQLSGGEKTVAALALLFAIHSYHPAPFFVLDEIDAALDNINVQRVSNYIRQRAHNDGLQCLVISLKDTFYTKADALVGVYRDLKEEQSGILSLDLTKYEQQMEEITA